MQLGIGCLPPGPGPFHSARAGGCWEQCFESGEGQKRGQLRNAGADCRYPVRRTLRSGCGLKFWGLWRLKRAALALVPRGWLSHEGHRFYKYLSPPMVHMARGIRRQIRRRGRVGIRCAGSLFGDAEFMVRAGRIKWLVYYPWPLVSGPLRSRPGCRGRCFR